MTTTRLRLSLPFRRGRGDNVSESLPHPQPPKDTGFEEEYEKRKQREQQQKQQQEEEAHNVSVQKAHEWLEETIRQSDRWTNHLSQIRLECPYTLAELRQLGHLPRAEGVRKCQALIRVPVIYDEIGLFVWTTLAAMELGGPDENHDDSSFAAEGRKTHLNSLFASLDERFRFDRPGCCSSSSSSAGWSPANKERRRVIGDSPPVSPKGTLVRTFSSSSPNYSLTRGRTLDINSNSNSNKKQDYSSFHRQGSIEEVPEETSDEEADVNIRCGRVLSRDKTRPAGYREGEAKFFNASRSKAPGGIRSNCFGEKVNSVVGILGKTVVTTLGEGLPRRQERRSLLLDRRRVKSF